MFSANGVREKDFRERMRGDEAFGAIFVLERVIARKPEDGSSRLGSHKTSDLH